MLVVVSALKSVPLRASRDALTGHGALNCQLSESNTYVCSKSLGLIYVHAAINSQIQHTTGLLCCGSTSCICFSESQNRSAYKMPIRNFNTQHHLA